MGKETNNSVLQWVTLVVLALLLIGSFSWMSATVVVDEQAIADKVNANLKITMPDIPVVEAYVNLTYIEGRLDDIEANLNEDDDWEDEAIALAIDEWEDRDYRDLFRWMEDNYTIVDRDDIDRVVVRDTDTEDVDTDDEDATVIQELKVYYEDDDGDDKKAYITVETTIEDGEVEDQDFYETD